MANEEQFVTFRKLSEKVQRVKVNFNMLKMEQVSAKIFLEAIEQSRVQCNFTDE